MGVTKAISMSKKIKVCFVSIYAWPLFEPTSKIIFGGSEVQLYQLAKELAKDNRFEVSFIVGDFGQVLKPSYEGIKVLKGFTPLLSKTTTRTLLNIKGNIQRVLRLWRALRKPAADIYIQRAAGMETGLTALICKLYRKKFVYMTAHEIDVSGAYIRTNALRGRVFGWGLKNASLVITQHQHQKELLEENLQRNSILIKSPVYQIPNIVSPKRDFVLWAGRADVWKKPELFLDLAREFPKEKFRMIYQPQPNYPALFLRLKEESQRLSNLELIEYVPFPEVDQYFRQAKVLVNTSEYEGFPNTFIQAAKNKTPILSYKVNPDDFINQYQCGYCAAGDFSKMVVQLKDLLDNQNLWNLMSENAFRYARENHDINKIIPQFKNRLLALNK